MTDARDFTATLTVLSGPEVNQSWTLTEGNQYRIGRGKECEIRLSDPSVSRVQCELIVRQGEVTLTDAGSRWGTTINGRRVDQERLQHGALMEIGDTEIRFESASLLETTLVPQRAAAVITPAIAPPPPPVSREAPPSAPLRIAANSDAAAEPAPLDLNALPGRQFVHYQVESVVARAASGIVYQAVDTRDGRAVALKIFWPAMFEDQKTTDRFLRSMRAMLPLEHEHLVKLFFAGREHELCFMASEFVAGESAAQLIARVGIAGMLDWRTAWKIGLGLAKALDYIHTHNVLHRNLRPNNILIRKSDDCVKLGDSMLAKSLDQLGQAMLTTRGEVVGDLFYLSPEQVIGSVAVDQRTDLYGLGATLYALLTGRPPFLGGPGEVISKILNEPPEPPTKTHLTIPASFEGVVLRLLAKHPDGRYANAALVVKDLERCGRLEGLLK